MVPVAVALAECGLPPSIILTGQHPDLDPGAFGLDAFPIARLHRPGRATPHRHVEDVRSAAIEVMRTRPDLLIVQGDTSSALGGALAGVTAGIALAHVEAGLRTHDRSQPWPEEEYRCRIDAEAQLLFAPTETAAQNLRNEGVAGEIHVTGNTGIDALMNVERQLRPAKRRDKGQFRLLVTCHRRENWGDGLEALADALTTLSDWPDINIDLVLHPNAQLNKDTARRFGKAPRLLLHPPRSHRQLVEMMMNCDLLLSDSGGVQEEAPALGIPLLVLRDKTERPEGIATGNMRLIGCRTGDIIAEVSALRGDAEALAAMRRRNFPYGDGNASARIASIVQSWIADQAIGRRRVV